MSSPATAKREGRGPRWTDQTRSIHLGSLPLALLEQSSAGDDNLFCRQFVVRDLLQRMGLGFGEAHIVGDRLIVAQ